MMAHKQMLHELLKEDQEPFQLKSYIQDRQSQLRKSSQNTALQLKKRNPVIQETSTKSRNLCKHACFLSFQNSPDVRKSPFPDFYSPAAKSPCKSPKAAVFLHIPSRTAALLVEAAMRIQKQQQSKPKNEIKNVGFGLFGSFLKRLRERSKNKKRAIGDSDIKLLDRNATNREEEAEESVRISCSCSNRRVSSAGWTEENNEDKSFDFEASTSSCGSDCSEEINSDFDLHETRFCTSPFRFSLHRSPPSSGSRTPEFCSPATSPCRQAKQEVKQNCELRNSDNIHREEEEEEEKEQCSPVSVLDPPFEDDDGHESRDADEDEDEDDYELDCNYENVQRAKQQLLHRLRRFEKLAELDPVELERKLLEGSDEEREEHEDGSPLARCQKHNVDNFITQVLSQSSFQHHSRNITSDMKRLVSDLIIEEKSTGISDDPCCNEAVAGRICNKLESWKEVEFNTIDMMIGLDFKTEVDGWTKFGRQLEEVAADIEVAICGLLVEELSQELIV